MPSPTKLYAYADESGQETEGRLFVVGVVVTGTERDTLLGQLEALETQSSKRKAKWQRSRPLYRQAYITGLTHIALLKGSLLRWSLYRSHRRSDRTSDSGESPRDLPGHDLCRWIEPCRGPDLCQTPSEPGDRPAQNTRSSERSHLNILDSADKI